MFSEINFLDEITLLTGEGNDLFYKERVKDLLEDILPVDFFHLKKSEENLPIIKWNFLDLRLNLISLSKSSGETRSFFHELLSRWLLPKEKIDIELFLAVNFALPLFQEDKFTLIEMLVQFRTEEQMAEAKKNSRVLETELRLGLSSDYHAKRILEFKGLSNDKKTALIQEKIGSLIQTRSQDFGKGIFSQMQHFLVTSKEEFKAVRDPHHISRIISNLHQIRGLLKERFSLLPKKRHLFVKFLRTKLRVLHIEKPVLGVLVGMNFVREREVFEKEHLVSAIKNFIPTARMVESSFFEDNTNKGEIQAVYLEVEKTDGQDFSFEEIQNLRFVLPGYLKDNVEQLVHSIFMPRNEEEIVRNLVTLSSELRFVHDIPQVMINFEGQNAEEILFLVQFLRLQRVRDPSLKDILEHFPLKIKLEVDRIKKIGDIRKRNFKEAAVLRLFLPIGEYLRSDKVVDVAKARQFILNELQRVFGEIRDYNGGLMAKQSESYKNLKASLGEEALANESLLEKFFYAIYPQEKAAILSTEVLKSSFLMLVNAVLRERNRIKKVNDWLFKEDAKALYLVVPVYDEGRRGSVLSSLEKLSLFASDEVTFEVKLDEVTCLGYIFFCSGEEKRKQLLVNIKQSLDF